MAETFPIYLAGEWVDSPHPLEIRNPYQDDLIGTTYLATHDQLETAIVAAEAVFPQLKTMPTFERVAILTKLAAKMREHRDEIARTICLEAAKPIRDAEVEDRPGHLYCRDRRRRSQTDRGRRHTLISPVIKRSIRHRPPLPYRTDRRDIAIQFSVESRSAQSCSGHRQRQPHRTQAPLQGPADDAAHRQVDRRIRAS